VTTPKTDTRVPYRLTRVGVVMSPEPGNDFEVEGVLNPAAGRTPDGTLHLLPRLVAEGNVSRVGFAEVVLEDGVPVGVKRKDPVLAPDEGWERGKNNAGVEDPRITWIPSLGKHVMSYVAYGPLGPKPALAVSENLEDWTRLGPIQFAYQADLDTDLNLFPNKDVVHFPEPVPGPDGEPCYAMLHRPMWDLGWFRPGEGVHLPAGVEDERPGIWISYVPAAEVEKDITALVRPRDHKLVALSEYEWESLKIGAGPAPIRV
jgi:beta-1,2-mannobiose phosphorylase / 1,2-beta-oligomannan phosphorylase